MVVAVRIVDLVERLVFEGRGGSIVDHVWTG
jgi:hypothetical protein